MNSKRLDPLIRRAENREAVEAILLLRRKGYSAVDVQRAWTADLPVTNDV